MLAELLDDIVPLEQTPQMTSWGTHIGEVFERMTAPFKTQIRTGVSVDKVHQLHVLNKLK